MASTLEGFTPADIDKKSPIPYHYQLTELIRNLISQEKWVKGDKLPSEREFCETFEISRITVRKALDSLEAEGLIQTNKGVGTFIREKKYLEKWAGLPTSFSDSLVKQGFLVQTQVLGLETVPPTEKIRLELNMPLDAPVVHIRRLRFITQEPILLVSSYLPRHLVPDIEKHDFTLKSLYKVLKEDYDIEIDKVKRGIEAIAATEEEARLLQVHTGAPLLQIENTSYSLDGKPVEYFLAKRRGDRTRFEFELSNSQV
jgi:GntR family transcriptional regulator